MDYQAEQEMELEALQAILMDDIEELHDDRPEGWPSISTAYRIAVNPEELDTSNENEYKLELVFAHTPHYPDEPPLYRARSVRGLSDADIAELNKSLSEQVEENMGMAMIYVLVSAAQEWLREKVSQGEAVVTSIDPEAARKAEEEAEERRLAEIRSHGTMITPQTFAEWKARFEAEMALSRAKLTGEGVEKKDKGLTGKQFFRQLEANNEQDVEDLESDEEEDYELEGEDQDEDEEEEEDDDDDFLDDYLADKEKN